MHRMKIGLVAAIVLVVVTAGVYSVVTHEMRDATIRTVESDVSRAQRMHSDIARLEALEFANLVAGSPIGRASSACSTSPTRPAGGRPRSSSARS